MTNDPFRCICDPDDLFEPPDPTPRAVEGCPAHHARRAAQQWTAARPACCDSHNQHCEPPGDLCCHGCTEASHNLFPTQHGDGTACVMESAR